MPISARYQLTYIEQGQTQKEAAANRAFDVLEKATAGYLSKSVAGGANVTLTNEEALQNYYFRLSGALTANISVIVPSIEKPYVVENATSGAFSLTVRTASGTGIPIPQGNVQHLFCNGTNVDPITNPTGAGAAPYDIGTSFTGVPGAGAFILQHILTRAIQIPAAMAGSQAKASTAATASAVFTVRKNVSGTVTNFGTITFAAAGTTGTFAAATATNFAAGDLVEVLAPNPADATLAGLVITLAALRT